MSTGDERLINRHCFVCDSDQYGVLAEVPYLFPLYSDSKFYNHTLVRCKACGNYFIAPTVTEELLERYYQTQTSYEISDTQTAILSSYELKALQQKRFILKNIDVSNMVILDFGCATAYTLDKFNDRSNQLVGFDTSKECSKIAKEKYGITVHTDFPEVTKYRYDLVMLSHVLEHLIEPQGILKTLAGLMKHDGYIYIEVPYIESFETLDDEEIFGHISFEHLNYFNEVNLTNLMEKAGFEKVDLTIAKNDDGTMPNYPVILSLWQSTGHKTAELHNSASDSFERYISNERMKMQAFQEKVYNKVSAKRIIVYGTGTHTYRLLAMCPKLKESVVGFSDGNIKKYTENSFFDLPCRSLDDFDGDKYEAVLISSKASEEEIYATLVAKTKKEIIKIYD